MKKQPQWQVLVAELRLTQCKIEASRQDVPVTAWCLLDGKSGMNMERPYDPVSDKSEAREDWESVYAVSSPVPECAIWNLLNNDGELGMPLLSATDWLKFVVGRSKADQVVLSHMMTKVLLRARWADACCQKMFNGWQFAVLRGQVRERKLVDMTTACDAARRSGLRDKEALAEARNQSNELQEEMRSDVEALTLSLQEAKD